MTALSVIRTDWLLVIVLTFGFWLALRFGSLAIDQVPRFRSNAMSRREKHLKVSNLLTIIVSLGLVASLAALIKMKSPPTAMDAVAIGVLVSLFGIPMIVRSLKDVPYTLARAALFMSATVVIAVVLYLAN